MTTIEQSEYRPQASATELEVMSGTEFFAWLSQDVAATRPGDRVALLTMAINPGEPLVSNLLGELEDAADRQVEISLGVDSFAFCQSVGPLMLPKALHVPSALRGPSYRRQHAALATLAAKSSVEYQTINEPTGPLQNPYGGRSHIKIGVVNDVVHVSGANMSMSERPDLSIRFENAQTANWLYDISRGIVRAGTTEVLGGTDLTHQIDDNTQLLMDVGRPGQSLIFDRARQIIDDADEWLVGAFQFFPDTQVANWLSAAADDNIEVHTGHSNPWGHGILLGSLEHIAMVRQRRRMSPALHLDQMPLGEVIHTHALANECSAIGGSHNMVTRSVNFGTAEAAVVREQDPRFARDMGALMLSQLGASFVGTPEQPPRVQMQ